MLQMTNNYEELINKALRASEAYYNGMPIMTDYDYDKLVSKIEEIEKDTGFVAKNSPTANVGASTNGLLDAWEDVTHEYPALSLDKTKDIMEMKKKFSAFTGGVDTAICMWKEDGCTLQATYIPNGKGIATLSLLATRGNGTTGKDITANAKYIKGLPLSITCDSKFVVRGECVMNYAEFERINATLVEDEAYSNPRNLGNATVTLRDQNVLSERELHFKAFKLVLEEGYEIPTMTWEMQRLESLGFETVEWSVVKISELDKEVSKPKWQPENYEFPVDGLVFAYNDINWAKNQPGTGHHPHISNGMALKWKDETATTTLTSIEWNTTKTGSINPVAVFEPVELEGTTVSRATLHNVSYILDKDICVSDQIETAKMNKIIPAVVKSVTSEKERQSYWDNKKFEYILERHNIPSTCPCCNAQTTLKQSNSGTLTLFCSNEFCSAKHIDAIVHFADRECMDIENVGVGAINDLVKHGFVHEISDFYHMANEYKSTGNVTNSYGEPLSALDGWGIRSVEQMVEGINASRKTTFIKYMASMAIPHFGHGQAKLIAPEIIKWVEANQKDYAETITSQSNLIDALALMVWTGFDFTSIDGIGEVIADSLVKWVDENIVDVYCRHLPDTPATEVLKEVYFTDVRTDYIKAVPSDSPIAGKTFVVTGDVHFFKNRKELQAKIEELGGKCTGSVTSKTDYLINNDINSTSSKNKKAKENNIPIITEDEFLRLAGI